MHDGAYRYIASMVAGRHYPRVVEVGSRDINGSIRGLVDAGTYIGIDLEDGPGVDVVADCRWWEPPWQASLTIVAEVLEHADDPAAVIKACVGYLRPGGRIVVTCAGPGRAPHSGHDGGPNVEGEWYANIEPADLERWLGEGCEAVRVEYHAIPKDCYGTGIRQ